MLQPKKTKYRKMQKGKMKGNTKRGAELSFGSFGIKTLEEAWITGRQIEAARQAVSRHMKREDQSKIVLGVIAFIEDQGQLWGVRQSAKRVAQKRVKVLDHHRELLGIMAIAVVDLII
jgi:hypothetical protein